jgi:hypothetical protein
MLSNRIKQIKAYPPYRRWHSIANWILVLGCVLAVISLLASVVTGDSTNMVSLVLGYAAIVPVVLFFVLNFAFWRCPKCHKTLPIFGPVLVCNICKREFIDSEGKPVW